MSYHPMFSGPADWNLGPGLVQQKCDNYYKAPPECYNDVYNEHTWDRNICRSCQVRGQWEQLALLSSFTDTRTVGTAAC